MDLRESRSRGGVRHPWERARFAFLERLLERHGRLAPTRVLDVGSGDAWLATRWLDALGPSTRIDCVDSEYTDEVVRALALPLGITPRTELPDARFPLVLALDVAEHVQDDVAFLRDLTLRMSPGGTLLFTVPAWPQLYSKHDRALGHHRRYTPASARALLQGAGLTIVEDGGFFHALIVPRLLALLVERATGDDAQAEAPDTRFRAGELAARGIAGVLRAEQWLTHTLGARGVRLPGLSYYALAVRDASASTTA